jgi:hypothetical protein
MANLAAIRSRIDRDFELNGSRNSDIDDAIRSAIRANQGRPLWFLHTLTTITLASGTSTATLPTDFGAKDTFRILINGTYYGQGDGFDYLFFDDLNAYHRKSLSSGQPRRCAVLGNTLYFDATADANYTIEVVYYKKDVTLPNADADTSVWFDDGQDVIRSHAMAILADETLEYPDNRVALMYARVDKYYSELIKQQNYRL